MCYNEESNFVHFEVRSIFIYIQWASSFFWFSLLEGIFKFCILVLGLSLVYRAPPRSLPWIWSIKERISKLCFRFNYKGLFLDIFSWFIHWILDISKRISSPFKLKDILFWIELDGVSPLRLWILRYHLTRKNTRLIVSSFSTKMKDILLVHETQNFNFHPHFVYWF